ncbi:hypothetical protein H7H37_25655, partial [Mycolicibacterium insubricum]|nr:hypothetical protein [Mycolicibacterium insubricum]
PVEAIGLLTGPVHYTEELPPKVAWRCRRRRPVGTGDPAPVLLYVMPVYASPGSGDISSTIRD